MNVRIVVASLVTLLASAGLAEPKRHVAIVSNDFEATRGIEKSLVAGGHRHVNASRQYGYFHGLSALMMGNLEAPAPDFWPVGLSGVWEEGIRACKSQAGEPPYGLKDNKMSFLCGRNLAKPLWQLWLEHLKFDYVIRIRVDRSYKKGVELIALGFHPGRTKTREVEARSVKPDQVVTKASELATNLLLGTGQGIIGSRDIDRELPKFVHTQDDQAELKKWGEPKVLNLSALFLPPACLKKLPDLKVESKSKPLSKTMMKQWSKSRGTNRATSTLNCRIAVTSDEPPDGENLVMFTAVLRCEGYKLKKNVLSNKESMIHESVSTDLLTELAKRICD